jgi:hypothetical protein
MNQKKKTKKNNKDQIDMDYTEKMHISIFNIYISGGKNAIKVKIEIWLIKKRKEDEIEIEIEKKEWRTQPEVLTG